jgi:3-hydroxyisobutyrate dehydrogenase-like beta-hydroxyacid dehydrogenase
MVMIGFLGAGQLGEPMVRRLLAAGHDVAVYARREEVRSRLRENGALLAESVPDLAERSDILICCLFSDAQLRETGTGPDGFIAHSRPDAVVVSHTTGAIATLTGLANSSPTPPAILDAPVSGTAEQIADGKLTVLVGGAADAVDRVKPVLAAYADQIIVTGELGSALAIKLINNVVFAANSQLVAAAVALGEQLGVNSQALLDALSVCSGGSAAASYVAGVGGLEEFAAKGAPFLRKDVAAAVVAAEQAGGELSYLAHVIDTGPLELAGSQAAD